MAMMGLLCSIKMASGIRFVIDKEECVSHKVDKEGDTLHISFVVIETDDSWHFTDSDQGVDLQVIMHLLYPFLDQKILEN